MNPSTGLAVFAKYPKPGQVKTRLAQSVGNDEAAALYVRLLGHFIEHTLLETARGGIQVTLFCDPATPLNDCRELFGFTGFPVEHQTGADLGARMKHALGNVLQRNGRALVVGTDCIDLSPALIAQASAALFDHDLCVGPTGDGGYYLLGLKKTADPLFDGMPWSTPRVLPLTLERGESLGWKTKILQPLRDVDNLEDWKAIGWRCDDENASIKSLRQKKK